jgi:hypothetical protein
MSRARLLPAVVVFGALITFALVAAVPRASAVEPFPIGPKTFLTEHFAINYQTNPDKSSNPAYITEQQATDLGGWAERAYAIYVGWGYPAPPPGPGGRIGINVDNFSGAGPPWTFFDAAAEPCIIAAPIIAPFMPATCGPGGGGTGANVAGTLELDSVKGLNVHEVAHVVFNLFEFKLWNESQPESVNNYYWLEQSAAEWAAYRVESFLTPTQDSLGASDNTGDCVGGDCGTVGFDQAGDPGWTFMEYLNERFGPDIVQSFFTDAASKADVTLPATTYIRDVLGAKSFAFEDVFTDYTVARLTGNFSILTIKGLLPTPTVTPLVGSVTGPIPTSYVAVSHFAARYIALMHGAIGGNDTGLCYTASLALNVTLPSLPSGVVAKPSYFANTLGATPQALTVSGSTATITVPWNTCVGSPDAYLSLPNPSTDQAANGKEFAINGTLTVDLNSPTAATLPPDPLFTGPTVAAPTADVAPTITVYGAEIVRVSTADRMIRLIVYSSGDGALKASAGTINLGTYTLRAGNNDIRFKLPQSLVNSLRKPAGATAAGPSVLTLKCVSPAGVAGATVARKITVFQPLAVKQAAAKKAAAKKAAAKKAAAKKKAAHKKAAASNR